MMKLLFGLIFQFIIQSINDKFGKHDSTGKHVRILDIPGFGKIFFIHRYKMKHALLCE